MNNIRQVRKVIYALKRRYGFRVNIILDSYTNDLQTGDIDTDSTSIVVQRAIVTTATLDRKFSYDLAFIAANKNFTYGGFFDIAERLMIIERKDLPSTYEPKIKDRCVYNSKRWEFTQIESVAENIGYMIGLKHLTAAKTENVEELTIVQEIEPSQANTPWLD